MSSESLPLCMRLLHRISRAVAVEHPHALQHGVDRGGQPCAHGTGIVLFRSTPLEYSIFKSARVELVITIRRRTWFATARRCGQFVGPDSQDPGWCIWPSMPELTARDIGDEANPAISIASRTLGAQDLRISERVSAPPESLKGIGSSAHQR